jgi:hypothetical protein
MFSGIRLDLFAEMWVTHHCSDMNIVINICRHMYIIIPVRVQRVLNVNTQKYHNWKAHGKNGAQ